MIGYLFSRDEAILAPRSPFEGSGVLLSLFSLITRSHCKQLTLVTGTVRWRAEMTCRTLESLHPASARTAPVSAHTLSLRFR